MINVEFRPWSIRGSNLACWNVWVEITDSHSLYQLRLVKKRLNEFGGKGLVIVENPSKALKKLGWDYNGEFYYKIFN